jgi:hypothetical protein
MALRNTGRQLRTCGKNVDPDPVGTMAGQQLLKCSLFMHPQESSGRFGPY